MFPTSSENFVVTDMANINGFHELTISTLDSHGGLHSLCPIILNKAGQMLSYSPCKGIKQIEYTH